jgi:hypothetical protein
MAQPNPPRLLGTAPEPYDGSPNKAIAFWNSLANYYSMNDTVFNTDNQKVASALTHFKIGTKAGEWASDQIRTALAAHPVNYGTWDAFKNSFERQFIPPASKLEALQGMHQCPMGNREFNEWYQEWSTYARRSDADEGSKMWAFRKNLPDGLRQKLLGLSPQPDTLAGLVEKTREFDRNYRLYAPTTRGRGSFRGRGGSARIQEIQKEESLDINATQMRRGRGGMSKRGRLTPQERQRRMAANLCLYCGKPGHIANQCPAAPPRNFGARPQVRQIETIEEEPTAETSLEGQLQDLNLNALSAFNVVDRMMVDAPQTPEDKPF